MHSTSRTRAPEKLDESILEVATNRDDGVEGVGPDYKDTLVPLIRVGDVSNKFREIRVGKKTYNKRSILLLVCVWEEHHGVQNLDTSICVNVYAAIICLAV
jgi:hypothetical protein